MPVGTTSGLSWLSGVARLSRGWPKRVITSAAPPATACLCEFAFDVGAEPAAGHERRVERVGLRRQVEGRHPGRIDAVDERGVDGDIGPAHPPARGRP